MDAAGQSSLAPGPPVSQKDERRGNRDRGPKSKVNKRTKTGCLTCRKRRIKCDETKPVCNKCKKSKRQCDGYNQTIQFKDHFNAYAVYSMATSAEGSHQGVAGSSSQGPHQRIAPKPMGSVSFPDAQYMPGYQNLEDDFRHIPQIERYSPFQNGYASVGMRHQPDISSTLPDYGSQRPHPDFSSRIPNHSTRRPQPDLSGGFLDYNIPRRPNLLISRAVPSLTASIQRHDEFSPLHGVTVFFEAENDPNSGTDCDDNMTLSDDDERDENVFAHTVSSHLGYLRGLRDPTLMSLFRQFVRITGPFISMYERQQTVQVEIEQICPPNQAIGPSLWTRTIPLLSEGHPALMHAVLALAGLQTANLRGIKPVIALQHYGIAIRRLHRTLADQSRVGRPSTIAASLLLAYFDVWQADHASWGAHLFGASIPFYYLDLKNMSRRCLAAKRMRQRLMEDQESRNIGAFFPTSSPASGFANDGQYIKFDLLKTITGFPMKAEDYCIGPNQIPDETTSAVQDSEIKEYETLRDLFWWYCKMDLYQSILGATKLFMRYENWTQCPPRGPINKIDTIYGTYDHLMLLLGRLADFSNRDLDRKQEANKQEGGTPPFLGMLPLSRVQDWPEGYPAARDVPGKIDEKGKVDQPMNFVQALQEWNQIRFAFDMFEHELGPDFGVQPLSEEDIPWLSKESPFESNGLRVTKYKTLAVAGIWMNFYMGRIHLERTRPNLPPAAVNAAVAAHPVVEEYAEKIGSIAAGLAPDLSQVRASDQLVCAALIESAFCLFVAAIHFKTAEKRQWLMHRMENITRITGWMSAAQIASGCKALWTKLDEVKDRQLIPWEDSAVPAEVQRRRRLDQAIDSQVPVDHTQRAHYALGLLGVEDDLSRLNITPV